MKGINQDMDYLQEIEIVNIAKNHITNFSYQTVITFPSPWKRPRKFDNQYRFFGVEIYKKVQPEFDLPNNSSTQTFTMTSKTLISETDIDIEENHPIDQVNVIVTMLMNNDISEDIYMDAIDFRIYMAIYQFKWLMIWFVMFNSAYLVVFTLLFVRETVVKPIIKLTNLIIKPEKYDEKMTKSFVYMVKKIEQNRNRKQHYEERKA